MRQDTLSPERQNQSSESHAHGGDDVARGDARNPLDERSPEAEARHWWTPGRIAVVVILWVIGLIALALLSVAAHNSPTFPGDVGIEELIQRIQQPQVRAFINFASDANWPKPAGIIAIVVIILLALVRRFRAAICAAFAGFGADLANVTLNGVVARPRPNNTQIHVVAHLGLHSYPSGHVTHVTAFYGFLLYLAIAEWRAHPGWRVWLWAPAAVCVYFLVFIGPSRVLEGEHWPSDVVGSWLLGGLMLVAAIGLYHLLATIWMSIRRRHEQRRASSHGALPPTTQSAA
ncbi:MAG: phosphatase PAP2 family protein [Ktedonobacterales bacterium]